MSESKARHTSAACSDSAGSAADKQTLVASKWNARYAFAAKELPMPADVLVNGAHFLPSAGVAIDIACGRGGNALYMAQRGLQVHAWDSSQKAIDSVRASHESINADLQIIARVRDVIAQPPKTNSADVIAVSRFLDRGLCASLVDALRPNGVLFYQTFTAGLSNPDYLLQHNELPTLFASLSACYYYETALSAAGFSDALFIGRKS